jgi:hypothetical protein
MQKNSSQPVSVKDAIYLLNNKVESMNTKLTKTIKTLETKLGNHENYVTENLPDMDAYNGAFSDINKRLLDLESLNERILLLETKLEIKPTTSSKKKSTVKLNELTDTGPGISFS